MSNSVKPQTLVLAFKAKKTCQIVLFKFPQSIFSSSSTEPIMPHYEFSSARASKHWLVLLFLMLPHCGCDRSSVLLSYSASLCVHVICWDHTRRIQISHCYLASMKLLLLEFTFSLSHLYTLWWNKVFRQDLVLWLVEVAFLLMVRVVKIVWF